MFHGATGTIYTPIGYATPRGGSQAEVFKVRDPQGAVFALQRARTPADSHRLLRELEAIDALIAANPACSAWLVQAVDRGEHEGRAFFVTPWHDASLEDWMRAAWPLGARLKQAAALCRLVERFVALAGPPWVHPNIHPANILLDDSAAEGLRLTGILGDGGLDPSPPIASPTSGYAPPELALPQGRQSGAQVDRFSTAVLVFELITGARPLRAAPQLWRDEGLALCSLHQQHLAGEALDVHEEAERARLSALPLSALMRPDRLLLNRNFDRALRESLGSGTMVTQLASSLRSMLSALPEERLTPPVALVPLLEALAAEEDGRRPGGAAQARTERGAGAHGPADGPGISVGGASLDLPPTSPVEGSSAGRSLLAQPPHGAPPSPTRHGPPDRAEARLSTLAAPAKATRGRWMLAMVGLLAVGLGMTGVFLRRAELARKIARIWNDAPAGTPRVEGDLVWVEIPAGRGQIGDDIDGGRRDTPAFLVQFSAPFEMLETEVTNRQYARLVPGHQPVNDEPVADLTWDDARSWCEQAGGRLPTELEWEYAARGGGSGPYGRGQGSTLVTEDNLTGYAWLRPTDKAQPVRQKAPNAWGLYDMWGNVMEWALDGYENSAWSQFTESRHWNATLGFHLVPDPGFVEMIDHAPPDHRVFRGGSAWDWNLHARSSSRFAFATSTEITGFRCVRAPDRPPVHFVDYP